MKESIAKKLTEIFPALTVWLTVIILVALSFLKPLWAIYFIIVFVVYWILRLFYMMIWLLVSWFKYRRDNRVDWLTELKRLPKNYLGYYHVITYPTYKEPFEVIERSLDKLLETDYPKDKMIVVIGGEGRDRENFEKVAMKIKEKFDRSFFKLMITIHEIQPDELPGKGSNVCYMEHEVKKVIDEMKLDYKKVITSCFDIETVPSRQYFSCVTYKYLTHPRPERASYQPLILYNNNIWQSNPLIRVVASATTFWLLTDLSRPEKLLTFSSHSMSFQMIVDVGFHDKTIVTDDSRIGLQGLVHYDGDYEVCPLFVTLSMDTVYIGELRRSLINQYKQMRRWAWGVEHFPWMWCNFFGAEKNVRIPLKKRIQYMWNQFEGMYSWATAPLIILLVGRLPLWLASDYEKATAIFQNAPRTLEMIMTIGMSGLVLNAIMYTFLLPARPKGYGILNYLMMVLQWVLFPITMVIFGAIPAFDAQTRLALGGRYRLGFWVTKKKV